MGAFVVSGSFYARRGDWQPFRKQHEADSPEQAREWALSEIGGCHHVKRHLIKIDSVQPAEAPK
jgi:ribosomal protein L20A (L18A)